jgi:hydrogenase maturation factor
MSEWVKIGNRFINLSNVCEVYVDPHGRTASLVYVGGSTETIDEDEARDLHDALLSRAAVPEEPHRTVFTPVRG